MNDKCHNDNSIILETTEPGIEDGKNVASLILQP